MNKLTLSVNKELDITIYTASGEVNYEEICEVINDHYKGPLTKYVILDYSAPSANSILTPGEVRLLAKLVCEKRKAQPGYCAFIVSDSVKYERARIFAAHTEVISCDEGGLKTLIFRNMDEAMTWIRHDTKFVKSDWQPPIDLQS